MKSIHVQVQDSITQSTTRVQRDKSYTTCICLGLLFTDRLKKGAKVHPTFEVISVWCFASCRQRN